MKNKFYKLTTKEKVAILEDYTERTIFYKKIYKKRNYPVSFWEWFKKNYEKTIFNQRLEPQEENELVKVIIQEEELEERGIFI